ncbi:signal transduction histidine kinase [Nitzschia inconspicua]|uniref:Signal transduction histidine kinase n=1 Tax=Nitzschia inconspicua TaxID=303405 RepID=A0A9K3KDW9_9STRA|nr:signal transduction histidine kinase [Nitzschia inconspicua]
MTDALCPTAKLLATVLDACAERAILLTDDGVVLHRNPVAESFLNDAETITDILVLPDGVASWKDLRAAKVVKKDGVVTRNERTLQVVTNQKCTCGCAQAFSVVYVESKHEVVRSMVDHAMDAVVTINEEGIIQTANPAAHKLFGYDDNELIGHNMSKLCGGNHAEKHNQYIQSYVKTGVEKAMGKNREVPCRHKDGHEFPCQLGLQEITPIASASHSQKRYFCGYLRDLTQQYQHEAEIKEKEELAQAMVNSSFDPMLEINEEGIITMVNDAILCTFGYTREEMLGSNVSIICGDDHGAHHDEYMRRYLETGCQRIIGRKRQVPAKRKDGSQLQVELGVQEVTLQSGKKVFCGYIRDLTAQHKDKRALRRQQQLIQGKFFGKDAED